MGAVPPSKKNPRKIEEKKTQQHTQTELLEIESIAKEEERQRLLRKKPPKYFICGTEFRIVIIGPNIPAKKNFVQQLCAINPSGELLNKVQMKFVPLIVEFEIDSSAGIAYGDVFEDVSFYFYATKCRTEGSGCGAVIVQTWSPVTDICVIVYDSSDEKSAEISRNYNNFSELELGRHLNSSDIGKIILFGTNMDIAHDPLSVQSQVEENLVQNGITISESVLVSHPSPYNVSLKFASEILQILRKKFPGQKVHLEKNILNNIFWSTFGWMIKLYELRRLNRATISTNSKLGKFVELFFSLPREILRLIFYFAMNKL